MKRLACFLLLGAFAATHPASAEDDNFKKQTPRNAGKGAARSVQGGQSFRANQNFQNPARVQRSYGTRQLGSPAAIRRQPNQAALNAYANRHPNLGLSTNVGVANDTAKYSGVANRSGRTRTRVYGNDPSPINTAVATPNANPNNRFGRNWPNGNGNWQGNNNTRDGNWQGDNNNRNGNWQGHNRWSNNHHDWDRIHRNRSWWRNHYTRFALFGGGYYYWNSGYWYPAYGYDPYFTTYTYDAPIYAYNDQDPGQVIAQVQDALQRRGYSVGGVDGTYGPMTRRALLNYQRDNGLPDTGEIDEQTLASLGLD